MDDELLLLDKDPELDRAKPAEVTLPGTLATPLPLSGRLTLLLLEVE